MPELNQAQSPASENAGRYRPKILCIADGPGWIFRRHVTMLERYLSDDFDFSVSFRGQPYDESAYDLIYPLEFNMVTPDEIKNPAKYVTGIRSFVAWADWDFLVLVNFLVTHFHGIHVVSQQLFDIFSPYVPGVQYVTHGVDTDFFSPGAPPCSTPDRLRLGWAGNRQTYVKGFREFIQPLRSLPGIELVYCGYTDRNLTLEEMPGFYNSIDAYVCASSFEGNNNSLLEAAAMERAIITTPNGTVPEYLQNNRSAIIVGRDEEQFKAAALRLRDNPDLRIYLGKQARKTLVQTGWDWKSKVLGFRQFFLSALQAPQAPLSDRILIEPADFRHYSAVLHTQFLVERDLRIGYASQAIDLTSRLNGMEKELETARHELAHIKSNYLYRINRRLMAGIRRLKKMRLK